jgi:UDP-glucose 4-epimerase
LLSAAHFLEVDSVPLDVSNYASTIEVFQRYKPSVVIHAAATKFVDLAEKFPNEAIDINITGSQNVARASMQTGVGYVVGVSTDKAAAPIFNLYGMTKAIMEKLFSSLDNVAGTRFATVRYGNVAWSTGSVFPIWNKMIIDKAHIVSTGPEMSRFFFSVDEAVTLVCAALANRDLVGGKVLSLPMKGTELKRVLDVWSNLTGCTWSLGDRRPGDRNLELLLSEQEGLITSRLAIEAKPYFLLHQNSIHPIDNSIGQSFTSKSAEQLSDAEIAQILQNPPSERFL